MLLSEIHKIINGRILTRDADFKEEQHPRDENGMFATKGSHTLNSEERRKYSFERKENGWIVKKKDGSVADDIVVSGKKVSEFGSRRDAKRAIVAMRTAEKEPESGKGIGSSTETEIEKSAKKKLKEDGKPKTETKKSDPATVHDIPWGEQGRGWFIKADGGLVDVTSEFGGGTNDHVGIFMMPERGEEFGLSKKTVEKLKKLAKDMSDDDADFDVFDEYCILSSEAMLTAMNNGAIRVRQHSSISNYVSIQGENITPEKVRTLIREQKIPFDRKFRYEIESGNDFVEVKWSILSDAKTWAEAKRRMTATDAKK